MGVGGQFHAPATLSPRKRPGTHCIGGWVGPRAVLDGCGKSRNHRDSIPGPSSPQQGAIPTALSRPTPLHTHSIEIHQILDYYSLQGNSTLLKYIEFWTIIPYKGTIKYTIVVKFSKKFNIVIDEFWKKRYC